eukprot:4114168-Prymnesium_polylepis.3
MQQVTELAAPAPLRGSLGRPGCSTLAPCPCSLGVLATTCSMYNHDSVAAHVMCARRGLTPSDARDCCTSAEHGPNSSATECPRAACRLTRTSPTPSRTPTDISNPRLIAAAADVLTLQQAAPPATLLPPPPVAATAAAATVSATALAVSVSGRDAVAPPPRPRATSKRTASRDSCSASKSSRASNRASPRRAASAADPRCSECCPVRNPALSGGCIGRCGGGRCADREFAGGDGRCTRCR